MVKNISLLLSLLPIMLLPACSSSKTQAAAPIVQIQAVASLQIVGALPGSKSSPLFRPSDPAGIAAITKTAGWINRSSFIRDESQFERHGYPNVLRIVTKDGRQIDAEPAYHCESKKLNDSKTLKTCSNIKDEVLLSNGSARLRLHSSELFDWIIEGWKRE
jgi:hypothetical protein